MIIMNCFAVYYVECIFWQSIFIGDHCKPNIWIGNQEDEGKAEMMFSFRNMPTLGLFAVAAGALGIGVAEFVIMGLLSGLSESFRTQVFGLPLMSWVLCLVSHADYSVFKMGVQFLLMIVFTIGKVGCTLASA